MSVKITVQLDNSKISIIEKAQQQALILTAKEVLNDIKASAVVPKDTGNLEDSGYIDESQIQNMVASIAFETPYARRLYWHPEYNFRRNKNANAQGKWMQDYLDGSKKEFVKETYMKHFKELSKGLIK